jgi:DNA-binding NtrC family response regulator
MSRYNGSKGTFGMSEPRESEKLKNYRVLVVDDEELLRDSMVYDFKRKGFTVFSAGNGVSALETVRTHDIHLVLSDISMPGGGGIKLLEEVRAFHASIPVVILMTGFTDTSNADFVSQGAFGVVFKPFDRKILMASVMAALGIPSEATV